MSTKMEMPGYIAKAQRLSGEAGEAWDERVRRMQAGTATPDDHRIHHAAVEALSQGRSLPKAAQHLPTKPPGPPTFTSDAPDITAGAIAIGIPPLIAEVIVRNKEILNTPAMDEIRRLESNELKLLILAGERGHGKSFAAAHWLWHGLHHVPPVLAKLIKGRKFVCSDELDVLDKHDQNDIGMASTMVIDDAGTENEYLSEKVALLIVRRYRNGLQTIITTNVSWEDFKTRYGRRVEDRVHEVGDFVVVGDDPEKSLRRRNQQGGK